MGKEWHNGWQNESFHSRKFDRMWEELVIERKKQRVDKLRFKLRYFADNTHSNARKMQKRKYAPVVRT